MTAVACPSRRRARAGLPLRSPAVCRRTCCRSSAGAGTSSVPGRLHREAAVARHHRAAVERAGESTPPPRPRRRSTPAALRDAATRPTHAPVSLVRSVPISSPARCWPPIERRSSRCRVELTTATAARSPGTPPTRARGYLPRSRAARCRGRCGAARKRSRSASPRCSPTDRGGAVDPSRPGRCIPADRRCVRRLLCDLRRAHVDRGRWRSRTARRPAARYDVAIAQATCPRSTARATTVAPTAFESDASWNTVSASTFWPPAVFAGAVPTGEDPAPVDDRDRDARDAAALPDPVHDAVDRPHRGPHLRRETATAYGSPALADWSPRRRRRREADDGDDRRPGRRHPTGAASTTRLLLDDGASPCHTGGDRHRAVVVTLRRPTGENARMTHGPTVVDAHLLGSLVGPGVERALPLEPGEGPDRPVGRVRPADPDRLRPRPRPRARRGRQGGRPRTAPRRDAHAVRGHPARRDEHVDDDQRHRDVAPRDVRRARRRAGRAPRRCCPARSRTTSSRSTCRAARSSSGRRRAGASPSTSSPTRCTADPEVEPDQRVPVPPAGGGRDAGAGARLRARDRGRRARRGARVRPGRAEADFPEVVGRISLLRRREHALRRGDVQDARLRRRCGTASAGSATASPTRSSAGSATACR